MENNIENEQVAEKAPGANMPAPVDAEKSDKIMIVSDGELPAPPLAHVAQKENVPPAGTPPVMEFDATSGEESMRGGYASVKGSAVHDRLVWTVVALMTVLCIVVAICSSMLTAFFVRRGKEPPVINTSGEVQQQIAGVVAARKPSIVEVSGNGIKGSGIIVKREGGEIYILTNAHMLKSFVNGGMLPAVRFFGEDSFYEAAVYGYNSKYDVAVLTVARDIAVFDLEQNGMFDPDTEYNEGDYVVSIGNAMGYGVASYDGTISRASELLECDELFNVSGKKIVPVLRTTAVINAGMSGGGVFDMNGRLIALGTYRLQNSVAVDKDGDVNTDVEDTGFATPVSIVYSVYKVILAANRTDRGRAVNMSYFTMTKPDTSAIGQIATPYGFICEYRQGKLVVKSLDLGSPNPYVSAGSAISAVICGEEEWKITSDICRTMGMLLRFDSRGTGPELKLRVGGAAVTCTGFRYVW